MWMQHNPEQKKDSSEQLTKPHHVEKNRRSKIKRKVSQCWVVIFPGREVLVSRNDYIVLPIYAAFIEVNVLYRQASLSKKSGVKGGLLSRHRWLERITESLPQISEILRLTTEGEVKVEAQQTGRRGQKEKIWQSPALEIPWDFYPEILKTL